MFKKLQHLITCFTPGAVAKPALFAAAVAIAGLAGQLHAQTWSYVGTRNFSPHEADYGSIAMAPDGTPYVVYNDFNTNKAVVEKFDGTAWVLVGSGGIDSFSAGNTDIKVDKNGTPYVSFTSGDDSAREIVMKYDGANWVVVGPPDGFTAGVAFNGRLALDATGNPYVAYLEDSLGCFVLPSMMKYNGTNWVHVGNQRFTTGTVAFMDMTISGSTPYFSYPDSGAATVITFDGANWVPVGARRFSPGAVNSLSIAVSQGMPFVAFQDAAHANKATMMKYDGSAWSLVGAPGFSDSEADQITLAIDKNGVPFVAFIDYNTPHFYGTVMKFNGSAWELVGPEGFTGAFAETTAVAIDTFGVPYLCYQDLGTTNRQMSVMKYNASTNTGISSLGPQKDILTIFPNPTHGLFTMNINSPVPEAHVNIINVLGEKVKEMIMGTNKPADVSLQAPAGVYYVSAILAGGEKVTGKLVIE